jgi:type IV pilus assembly protein PilP
MKLARWLSLGFMAVWLSACGSANDDDLRSWMLEQRSQMKPRLTPISEPKPFQPEDYNPSGMFDPFSKDKLATALKRELASAAAKGGALIAPELKRRKEALEAYPLDSLTMVGSLMQQGQPAALIRVDNLLYQVRLGQHLGNNFGKVTQISETEVKLREIVQDAAGQWVERPASLQLLESVK